MPKYHESDMCSDELCDHPWQIIMARTKDKPHWHLRRACHGGYRDTEIDATETLYERGTYCHGWLYGQPVEIIDPQKFTRLAWQAHDLLNGTRKILQPNRRSTMLSLLRMAGWQEEY